MMICAECDYTGNKAGFSAHRRHSGHHGQKAVSGERVPCVTCGTYFYAYKNQKYCTPACKPTIYHPETFTCLTCGKESTGYPGQQYCSRKCSAQGQKTKKCGQCDFTSQHYSRFTGHQARTGHSTIEELK